MIGIIGAGLSLAGGLFGGRSERKKIKQQKQQIAAQESQRRTGLALQDAQLAQQARGNQVQIGTQTAALRGQGQVASAESGVGGTLASEVQHETITSGAEANAGVMMNLRNQLTQNRSAMHASAAGAQSHINSLKATPTFATMLNSVTPWLGQIGQDMGWLKTK